MQPDEGRNAEVAREMKESGSWLVPTYNGVDYLDKPSFFFKAVAFSLAAFGDNEAAARLPSALFGLALVAMVYAFCRRVYQSSRVAWLAVIAVAGMPLFFAHARIVIFDMTLAFFVCGAIFAGCLAEEAEGRTRRNWYLLGSAAAGFATLVKGPVGFIIPMLVLLVSQRMAGRRGVWRRLFHPFNFIVFFAITLPWFVGLCLKRPDFLHYGLVEESFNRFTDASKFQRGKPFYYYAVIVAATFFPWSLLLPEAAVTAWKRRRTLHRADVLCVVWSVLVVLFFSISQSKQPGYVLSVTVACGILMARLFDAALANVQSPSGRLVRRATMVLTVVTLVAFLAMTWGIFNLSEFIKAAGINIVDAQSLKPHLWAMAIAFAALTICGAVGILRRRTWMSILCFGLCCPLFLVAGIRGADDVMEFRSGRSAAESLSSLSTDTEIACLRCFPNGLPFYLGRTFTLISEDGDELTSNYVLFKLKKTTDWPKNIVPEAEFDHWLATRTAPVYLIVRSRDGDMLETLAVARGSTVDKISGKFQGALLPPEKVN